MGIETVVRARLVAAVGILTVVLAGGCGADPDDAPTVGDTGGEQADQTDEATDEPSETSPADEVAYSEVCGNLVEQAAAVGDMEDTVEDLDPAIGACGSLDALRAATDDHPGALDGVDVEGFVSNRCFYSEDPQVSDSAICREVG